MSIEKEYEEYKKYKKYKEFKEFKEFRSFYGRLLNSSLTRTLKKWFQP